MALVLLYLLLDTSPGWAEIFRYKDENGTMHVVESLDAIPEKYRTGVKQIASAAGGDEAGMPVGAACKGKQACGIAYLSSSDPYSRELVASLSTLARQNSAASDKGLLVVIGSGKPEENEAMAKAVGAGGIVDNSGDLLRTLGVKKLPAFLVLDGKGNIKSAGPEAKQWILQSFAPSTYTSMPDSPEEKAQKKANMEREAAAQRALEREQAEQDRQNAERQAQENERLRQQAIQEFESRTQQ